jgi:hypothetical protein
VEAAEYLHSLRSIPQRGVPKHDSLDYVRKAVGILGKEAAMQHTPYELAQFIVYGKPLPAPVMALAQ